MDRGRKYKHSLQSLCNCPRGSRKRGANALGAVVFRSPTSHTNSNIYVSFASHPRSDFPFGTSTQEEKDYTHIYTPTRVGDYRQAEERQTYHAPSCKWGITLWSVIFGWELLALGAIVYACIEGVRLYQCLRNDNP